MMMVANNGMTNAETSHDICHKLTAVSVRALVVVSVASVIGIELSSQHLPLLIKDS